MITLAHQEYPDLSLTQLCTLMGVSKSWYYEHLNQLDSGSEDIALRDQIERIILEFSGYGYRRVTHALSRQGWTVNHKRVLRIMQEVLTLPDQKTFCDHDDQFAPRISSVSQCALRSCSVCPRPGVGC